MNKKIFIVILCWLWVNLRVYADQEKKVLPPKKMIYEGRELTYNPSWQDKETYLEVNVNDDPDNEIIISFIATYKPKPEKPSKEEKQPFLPSEKETIILQNYAFYQIYDKDPSGYFTLVKTITGMDQSGEVRIVRLDENSPNAIVCFSPGGERYMDLSIYQWADGGYRLLFNKGSSEGIVLDSKNTPLTIRMGKPREEGRPWKENFIWDDKTKDFRRLTKNSQ